MSHFVDFMPIWKALCFAFSLKWLCFFKVIWYLCIMIFWDQLLHLQWVDLIIFYWWLFPFYLIYLIKHKSQFLENYCELENMIKSNSPKPSKFSVLIMTENIQILLFFYFLKMMVLFLKDLVHIHLNKIIELKEYIIIF